MKKRIHFLLSQFQFDKLSEICNKTGISLSELLRRIIDDYLDTH